MRPSLFSLECVTDKFYFNSIEITFQRDLKEIEYITEKYKFFILDGRYKRNRVV